MNTVTIDICSLAESLTDFSTTWRTGKASGPRISFDSPELLWKVLTAKRWEILRAMIGAGPLTMREVAQRIGRNVKGVHTDIEALVNAGLIECNDAGKFVFPYDAIHVNFMFGTVERDR